MATIKAGGIYRVVEQLSFCLIFPLHRSQPAFFLEPLANEAEDINAPRVWGVIERFIFDMGSIIQHRVKSIRNTLQQIVADDYERNAAGSHIFLRAGIDERIFFYTYRVRKN